MRTIGKILAAALVFGGLVVSTSLANAQGGVALWTNYYDGWSWNDTPYACAVDTNGNVFVTGTSYAYYQSPAYYATIKYSGAGVPLWTNLYHGPPGPLGPDAAFAIAVDSSGNVVVTGLSNNYGDPGDATIKYSNAGVPLWTNRYDGPASGFNYATAIAVDSSNSVIVTGGSTSGNAGDYATIKCSSAGAGLWTNRYHGPGTGFDLANAIAVDVGGSVFVTGQSVGSGGDFDYATIKYSAAGAPQWTNRYNGSGNSDDWAYAIAVDNLGSVVVTGYSTKSSGGYDYATISYSSAGAPQWTNRYNALGAYRNYLAVDRSGNVFVTGSSGATNGYFDYLTVAYSSAGVLLWTNRYYRPPTGSDYVRGGVAVDPNGNVLVAGDTTTLAYSGAGALLWTNLNPDIAMAIAVDRNGNVVVAGGYSDYSTVKYSLIPPPIHFQRVNNQLVLSWITPGFSLQSAPAVTDTFTNIPGATSPYTNLLSGPKQYFRLKGSF